ncbi:MAG: hypothetical protein LBP59_14765 [Planctomycetaceae bacterium]|nr:hypothetical protein [Planctomycetaceae bacterium]
MLAIGTTAIRQSHFYKMLAVGATVILNYCYKKSSEGSQASRLHAVVLNR